MATATKAAQTAASATDAAGAKVTETVVSAVSQASTVAGDIATRTTQALAPVVQSATDKTRELTETFTAEFKKFAGLSVDSYHQAVTQYLDYTIEFADAAKVDWVSELTRHNAKVVGDLVTVSSGAAHDLLK